jgi:hypothetical protein
MGATQSVATIRVFSIKTNRYKAHYWNFPDMPPDWSWQSAGVGDYEIISPTEAEEATIEECFTGNPDSIVTMRAYLKRVYDHLQHQRVIKKYAMTDQIVIGRTFWERLLSILKRDN